MILYYYYNFWEMDPCFYKTKLLLTKANASTVLFSQPPGQVTGENVYTVWICGDGLVALASELAELPTQGITLAQSGTRSCVYWKGVQGMVWDRLMPTIHNLRLGWPNPDVLILHLGNNDVNMREVEDLLSTIKRDLESIHSVLPQCLIVWSDILPRHGIQNNKGLIDLINLRVHALVAELGGTAISHETIGPELYCGEGVFLSQFGIQMFIQNIKLFVNQWEMEVKHTLGTQTHSI